MLNRHKRTVNQDTSLATNDTTNKFNLFSEHKFCTKREKMCLQGPEGVKARRGKRGQKGSPGENGRKGSRDRRGPPGRPGKHGPEGPWGR